MDPDEAPTDAVPDQEENIRGKFMYIYTLHLDFNRHSCAVQRTLLFKLGLSFFLFGLINNGEVHLLILSRSIL